MIPSIDLKGGDVVRLLHGEMSKATIYGSDPAAVASKFQAQSAAIIHVVDLDGAIAGAPRNLEAIKKIRAAVDCKIDVSGGLRTIESVRSAFAAGADHVSIGSAAILNPELLRQACSEFPGRVLGGADMREGRLAIKGWVETSELTIRDAILRFKTAGVIAVTVTDIARDGARTGVDHAWMATTAKETGAPLIASGGIAELSDITSLARHFRDGVVGVIIGRALYESRFDLSKALAATANH